MERTLDGARRYEHNRDSEEPRVPPGMDVPRAIESDTVLGNCDIENEQPPSKKGRYIEIDFSDVDSLNNFFCLHESSEGALSPPSFQECFDKEQQALSLPNRKGRFIRQTSCSTREGLLGDCHRKLPPDHILVGYAFGPKKMRTMSIIMAEASNAIENEVMHPAFDCASLGGVEEHQHISALSTVALEDTPTIVTCSSLVRAGDDAGTRWVSSCDTKSRLLTASALEKRDASMNGGHTSISTASLCSMKSTLTASTITAATTANVSKPGGASQSNTSRAHGQQPSNLSSCTSCSSSVTATRVGRHQQLVSPHQHQHQQSQVLRVSFVPLDLDLPLEEQHGGHFDAILHKLTEDILCVSRRTTGSTAASCASCTQQLNLDWKGSEGGTREAAARLSRLTKYASDRPTCCLVDHPAKVEALMSRARIADMLSRCLVGITTRSGLPVRTPRFMVCWNAKDGSRLIDRVDAAPFTYPLIAKPLTAAGTKESHKMVISLGRDGLRHVPIPCILQEYLNHNGRLFKVYVLGDDVRVFERISLPNLPHGEKKLCSNGEMNDNVGCCYVEFDSQKPYPTLSDFGVPAEPVLCANDDSDAAKTSIVTADEIRPVATVLRRAFSLELFGFDIIVSSQRCSGTAGSGGTSVKRQRCGGKEMMVVDVNYFPSYKEVSNFPSLLAQYLKKRAVKSRSGLGCDDFSAFGSSASSRHTGRKWTR